MGGVALAAQRATRAEGVALVRRLPAPVKLPAALVHGGSGARFAWGKLGGVERIDLEEGEIDLQVRHLGPDERVLVSTGDAEVEVRGTVFQVTAHARHIARVAVAEGRVEVRYAGEQVLLDAGQAWSPVATGGDSPSRPAPPVNRDDRARVAGSAGAPEGVRAEGPSGDDGGAASRRAVARGRGRRRASAASAASARARAPQVDAKGSETAGARSDEAAKGFVEGMALVARGDYAAGAEKLEQYRKAHGDDARAEDAAYMSVLALQRAGRREEAAAAARRYLAAYPNGRRRAEVAGIAR